jgi:hypothetical protein
MFVPFFLILLWLSLGWPSIREQYPATRSACRRLYTTSIDCHITNLLLNSGQVALIGIIQNKTLTCAIWIATFITLFACGWFSMLDNLSLMASWTMNWF